MKNNPAARCSIALILGLAVFATSNAQESVDSGQLPNAPQYNIATLNNQLGTDTVWRDTQNAAIARVINPDDYECISPTDFGAWVDEQIIEIFDLGFPTFEILDGLFVFLWAGDSTLLFDNDASDEYIGVNGEYTREQIKRHKDNRRFWDVPTDDILLMGMHGAVIGDDARMLPFVDFQFDPDSDFPVQGDEFNQYILSTAQTAIVGGVVDLGPFFGAPLGFNFFEVPGIPSGYDNPMLTLNAFAFSDGGVEIIPGFGLIPDKIVMGDGILEGLEAIGLGRNAPDFVHAHEFAHHVQFEIGAFDSDLPTQPERTRRTELMADAFGAYYSSHARGATFQAKNFADVMRAASVVGDCQFESGGHHGTPNQRDAAASWGGGVATGAKKQGHIKPSLEMLGLFDAELPNLVAPDAE